MSHLVTFFETKCSNCKRFQFDDAPDSLYRLDFHVVSSKDISQFGHPYQTIRQRKSDTNLCDYNLCDECYHFLVKKDRYDFEHMWPAFFWRLLSNSYSPTFEPSRRYFEIYSAEHLWELIPVTMRGWWINIVKGLYYQTEQPYSECTIDSPPSIFIDKTKQLQQFENDLSAGDVPSLIKTLNNESIMTPTVLCPFGCTDYCHRSKYIDLDVNIQYYLRKVVLPIKSRSKYVNVHSMSPHYFRKPQDYDTVMLNESWPILPTIIITDVGAKVLTCRHHSGGDQYLRLYPPLTPHHNLSALQADQLSHVKATTRIAKPTRRFQNNTTFSMVTLQGGFSGVDSMTVSSQGNWYKTSYLLSEHESNSFHGRNDIKQLLSRMKETGLINERLAASIEEEAMRITENSLDRYCQGSTYVTYLDMIGIHLDQTQDDHDAGLIEVIKCVNNADKQEEARRSWSRTINIIQMEDSHCYGTQFRHIPQLSTTNKASMMTWTLCSILSSVKELWKAVDNKLEPWHYRGWEGWILTYIQSAIFRFVSIRSDYRSPFKKLRSMGHIVDKINYLAPVISNVDVDITDPGQTYQYSSEFMENLFTPQHHPTISIFESVLDISPALQLDENKNIIIITSAGLPEAFGNNIENTDQPDTIEMSDGVTFELRSIVLLRVEEFYNRDGSKFESIRYMRHGGHFCKWWKQERSDAIVIQCSIDPVQHLYEYSRNENIADEYHFLQHCLVYVKVEEPNIDKFRLKIAMFSAHAITLH